MKLFPRAQYQGDAVESASVSNLPQAHQAPCHPGSNFQGEESTKELVTPTPQANEEVHTLKCYERLD